MPTTTNSATALDQLCINTIRTLSMDAVQKANSGHPGAPMALAPLAYTLWTRHLRHNPANPKWPNRDRFVLSNGHASMLLYSMLFLTGYGLTLDDIKAFRQWGSKTPGHPEYGLTAGVETTTGPLGQGVGNSVGMAIAERWLATHFNRAGNEIVNYRVYAFCSDGDLMEGVSHEAASLAGHLGLSNLMWFYDNNHITIEGNTSLAYSDDVTSRFQGYGWDVQHVSDVNDLDLLEQVIAKAHRVPDRPQLIIVDTHIGYGSPHRQDTAEAHGEALGEEEVRLTKQAYGWPPNEHFLVPEDALEHMRECLARGGKLEREWQQRLDDFARTAPELYREWQTLQNRELPPGWESGLPNFPADPKGMASRAASGKVLNAIAPKIPWLMGGSADLAGSTKTLIDKVPSFERDAYEGRNFHFGIREHGMGSVMNGMALSGLRPYGATFLIFSDYMRPAIRLAALMDQPTIYVFTHDSIGLGEDGPTHQPIEQLMSLRAIPRLIVIRPADANEVTEAWRCALLSREEPVALVLTRQNIPTFDRARYAAAKGLRRGAYIMADCAGEPQVILIGTGSEVQLCAGAYEQLTKDGVRARLVSMPSWKLFEKQTPEYREQVLPAAVRARVAVEAGTDLGWQRYTGDVGRVISRRDFGASAPVKDLLFQFGFTVEKVVEAARAAMADAAR